MNIDKWTMAFSQNNSNAILWARSKWMLYTEWPSEYIEINSWGINYNWISLLLHAAVKERNKYEIKYIYEN